MTHRSFPVLYSGDVERVAAFYTALGFVEHARLPAEGPAGFVGLRRDGHELAVVTRDSPEQLIGIGTGPGPCFEMFVYVDDVDATVGRLRELGVQVLKEPADMFWGERVAYVKDPEGNPVALAGGDNV